MTKNTVAKFCAVAAVVALPTLSWAGTSSASSKAAKPAQPAQALNESAFSADLGANVVTSYYSRGIEVTNHSASIQPYADVYFTPYKGDGLLNKVTFGLGLWQSYTNPASFSHNTGNNKSLLEEDITPSIALTFGKFTLTESYLFLNFPNSGGSLNIPDAQGVSSKLSYDDSDLLGALALHPAFTWVKETDHKIGSGAANKLGNYYEIAVAPSAPVGPVTVSLPLTAGFGSNGFYNKDGYGYFSAGLNVAYTLPVSKNLGTWTTTVGATYYNLNKSAVGGNADNDVVGSVGLGVAF